MHASRSECVLLHTVGPADGSLGGFGQWETGRLPAVARASRRHLDRSTLESLV